ncbi:YjbF family lipoprotein [Pseudomonas abieticivorans]|uniref:YjbF family lipoprotein n=1 Tax=Pseudomonas abieticivorans TaxID=2931382 RepID=UPI0020BE650E|nr:YjbF family lipoprotein [Pseudomonas sp. PIA16]
MNIYRTGAALLLALGLGGCDPLSRASVDDLVTAIKPAPALQLSPSQIASVPYAQLKLTTPSGEGVLALVRQRGDLQFWVASGKQVLMLRDGLVVRSVGLGVGEDLDGTQLAPGSPFKQGLHQVADGYQSERLIDLYHGYRVGVPVHSRFSRGGLQTLRILDKDYAVLRLDEQIDAPAIGLQATNHYWVDPQTGAVLQSEQHLTPTLTVTIVQLAAAREPLL